MRRLLTVLIILLGMGLLPSPAAAQQPADSARAAALRDYHGPDLEGKDGPLAKAGLDLLVLYHEYRAFKKRNRDATFTPSGAGLQVTNGHVTIDAIATDSAEALQTDLQALGLKRAATAGRIVSGRLPIGRIPELAELRSLRGAVPSSMRTRDSRARPAPDLAQPPADTATAPDSAGTSTEEDHETFGTGEVLAVLSVVAGLLGLFYFLRR